MNVKEFREWAHLFADKMADYYEDIESYPVKSQSKPGEIFEQIPNEPPVQSESMCDILNDFDSIIMPGITHWQSPNFFAYFPANASFPSILAEMLTATLGTQCMIWETSPSAAELEEKVMNWLKTMTGIPSDWHGVIQDTASTATLAAILTARESKTNYNTNEIGINTQNSFRVYCSTETHSSIEKAVKIAGLGRENLIKIKTDASFRIDTFSLIQSIEKDIEAGFTPLCVVVTLGTTSCTAIDTLKPIAEYCQKHSIWVHIDAAYAGSALLLPEYRFMIEGIHMADSFVFNPHKWMFTNFDCSAYFVKNKEQLLKTFEILPEYLKTASRGKVNDYRDWGIPLGRRFRALKLWFVIRSYGVSNLKQTIRKHIQTAKWLENEIIKHPSFEIMAPVTLSVVCFRYKPSCMPGNNKINTLNETLLQKINNSGKLYITHTVLQGNYTLRLSIAGTHTQSEHVYKAWEQIQSMAAGLSIPN